MGKFLVHLTYHLYLLAADHGMPSHIQVLDRHQGTTRCSAHVCGTGGAGDMIMPDSGGGGYELLGQLFVIVYRSCETKLKRSHEILFTKCYNRLVAIPAGFNTIKSFVTAVPSSNARICSGVHVCVAKYV